MSESSPRSGNKEMKKVDIYESGLRINTSKYSNINLLSKTDEIPSPKNTRYEKQNNSSSTRGKKKQHTRMYSAFKEDDEEENQSFETGGQPYNLQSINLQSPSSPFSVHQAKNSDSSPSNAKQ